MSKTSKKLNMKVGNVLPNFGGHVLGCIEADFCKTNMRFAAFFKLYNICALLHRSSLLNSIVIDFKSKRLFVYILLHFAISANSVFFFNC